ncbi:uncharacterized protein [Amphiura filiformis]|uniref:uncharacterized protein n=1 Tax=Amphiura filiformis TaxID=82378 RepID=UPI003B20E572
MPIVRPTCSICGKQSLTIKKYVNHCRSHIHDRNSRFPCCVPTCIRTCYTYKGLTSHIAREHNDYFTTYRPNQLQANEYRNVGITVRCTLEFCQRKCSDLKELLAHSKEHLTGGLRVSCPFSQCDKLFNKKSSFSSHISRCHKNYCVQDVNPLYIIDQNIIVGPEVGVLQHDHAGAQDPQQQDLHDDQNTFDNEDWSSDDNDTDEPGIAQYTKYIAIFLLKLQAKYMIPDSTIQVIVDEMHFLQQCSLDHITRFIKSKLHQNGTDQDLVEDIAKGVANLGCSISPKSDLINTDREQYPESGTLGSHYLRQKYYQEKMKFVSPVEIVLQEKTKTTKKHCCHYVPILETLKVMCEDKSFQSHTQQTDYGYNEFRDVQDGKAFKDNPFYSANPDALQIILFKMPLN